MNDLAATWPDPVVIISPHLDDAALSLGATIAMLARHGVSPRVVTVMATTPTRTSPPAGGTSSAASRARGLPRARRSEDARACTVLGAEAVWLLVRPAL